MAQDETSEVPFGPPSKADMQAAQQRPENRPETYGGPDPAPSSSSSGTTLVKEAPGRQVFALMGFAVIFSLIGHELNATKSAPNPVPAITSGGQIIVGGVIATTLLIGLTHFGEAGAQLGVGLALVTTITAVLVEGAPVWSALGRLFGSKPTTPLPSTTPSTPTTSPTKTASALAQAA